MIIRYEKEIPIYKSQPYNYQNRKIPSHDKPFIKHLNNLKKRPPKKKRQKAKKHVKIAKPQKEKNGNIYM